MGQALVSKSTEVFTRLALLHSYREAAISNPQYFDIEVKPAAENWLDGEIAQIERELFGIKKEAATLHGDYSFNALENLFVFSIPATEQEGKNGQAYV
jgi:hypothetical protein